MDREYQTRMVTNVPVDHLEAIGNLMTAIHASATLQYKLSRVAQWLACRKKQQDTAWGDPRDDLLVCEADLREIRRCIDKAQQLMNERKVRPL